MYKIINVYNYNYILKQLNENLIIYFNQNKIVYITILIIRI